MPWLHGRILAPQWFCPCGQCHHQNVFKNNRMAAPVKVARQQTTPELSWTFRNTGTLPNPPEPSGSCLRNLHQHKPGTFRNLPPEPTPAHTRNLPEPASGTYTSTHRNSPEPFGTCLQNLHQHTPELSGTFWNLPPEPAPATRTSTHRSLYGLKTPLAYAVGEKVFFFLRKRKNNCFFNLKTSSFYDVLDYSLKMYPG